MLIVVCRTTVSTSLQ